MSKRVCPWWLGYFLATPLRKLWQDPKAILPPYVHEGMTVLEPGPGMGFFTLELARLVGPAGRVVAVDIQPRMVSTLERRLRKAGLLERVDVRLARPESLGVDDLTARVDFTLAFAVVHERPDAARFFQQAASASKLGATLLLVEPAGHVKDAEFRHELEVASHAGFTVAEHPTVGRNHTALLKRAG